jgi:hypothetical protein
MMRYPGSIRSADFRDRQVRRRSRPKVSRAAQRSESGKDRSNVVNVQTAAVESLELEVGGQRTTSHVGHANHEIASDDDGRVHFVPANPADGSGGDAVKIHWRLKNPRRIKRAKLELFVRGEAQPVWSAMLRWKDGVLQRGVARDQAEPCGPKDATHTGSIDWDGCFDATPAGWDQPCVSAGHSPYKLKLSIVVGRQVRRLSAEAWTYFDVLVGQVKLHWERHVAKDTIVETRADIQAPWTAAEILELEKQLCDDLYAGKITDDHEICLAGNLFTQNLTEEGLNDSLYRAYRDKWGDGPLIPLFARVKLRNAADALVDAPWALSGAKFLWDWEDRTDNKAAAWLGKEKAGSKDFVRDALDYLKAAHADSGAAPRGSDNCHVDHGGKRGEGAKPVFPAQNPSAAGYDGTTANVIAKHFPFAVAACDRRGWAAMSSPRCSGVLAGRTGVLFQPSRMAGDAYRVSVYFVPSTGFPFDAEGYTLRNDVPAKLRDRSGLFEIWRKLDVRLLRRHANVANVSSSRLRRIYRAAGIKLEITSALIDANAWQTAYDDTMQEVYQTHPGDHFALSNYRDKVAPAVAAHSTILTDQRGGEDALSFHARGGLPPVPDEADWDRFYTVDHYGRQPLAKCASLLMPLIQRRYIDAQFAPVGGRTVEGVFTFLYRQVASQYTEQMQGAAHSPTSTISRAAVYVAYNAAAPAPAGIAPDKYGAGEPQLKGYDYVVAHEIAHALFLYHAAPEGPSEGPHLLCATPDPEPVDDDVCLMNYHPKSTRFCGICILRLRGWAWQGPDDGHNTEALVRLHQAAGANKVTFKIHRVAVSVPVTPPHTKRKMPAADTFNVPDRVDYDRDSADPDFTANPPLVLLAGTVVDAPMPADPALKAVAKPLRLRAVVEMPATGSVVWKVVRAPDDADEVIAASPRPLPTLTPVAGTAEATLLSDAVGSFGVLASVDPTGGNNFDDEAPCVCVNVVFVGVTRLESRHAFTSKHIHHTIAHNGDPTIETYSGNHHPMKVKTKVRLLGGGADAKRGLDKVFGGWINNLRREDTEAVYRGPGGVARARTYDLHRRPDNTYEPLQPPLSVAQPLVDCGGGASMANWIPYRAVLSVRAPEPTQPLPNSATDLTRGCRVWISAEDGPSQGWDIELPSRPGAGLPLGSFNLDLEFCAYLCLWTADANCLVGVIEEVPWTVSCRLEYKKGHYKLSGEQRVAMQAPTTHASLVAALTTGAELCPPTGKTTLRPRNITGTAIGTDWTTGQP